MTNPNDPAFQQVTPKRDPKTDQVFFGISEGLTKREYFAAMAMQGTLANSGLSQVIDRKSVEAKIPTEQGISNFAIRVADALIAALTQSESK